MQSHMYSGAKVGTNSTLPSVETDVFFFKKRKFVTAMRRKEGGKVARATCLLSVE